MDYKAELLTGNIEAFKRSVLQSASNEVYIPLHGKHTTNPEEESFDLAEKIQSFFVFDDASQHDPKVMLFMGDTGSGKSVFSQQLHQQLWRAYATGDPIPLWIPLPELENPFDSAVEEILRKYGFDDGKIAEIKAKEKFIFIVDGYDELHQFQNCYVTNKWHQWNVKILITCRSQALYYQKDPDKYFMPFNGEKRLPQLLRRLYVAPFSKDQISAYVKKYQQLNTENRISEKDFAKVPGLSELIKTPFLLHLAVEALPDILAAQVDDKKMTQAKLYDVFMERWFTRQIIKLSAAGLLKETEQTTKQQFWDYCKRLAQQMHEKEVSVIPYQGQKAGGRLFGKQPATLWDPFFKEDAEVLRSACPLKRFGEHYYGFVHASMVEYFATRAMYEEIQNNELETIGQVEEGKRTEDVDDKDINSPIQNNKFRRGIHYRVFAQEPNSIQNLADRIEMEEEFKRRMLKILEASKKSKRYAIGAANAITALVRAGVTFNGADLSSINIREADISGGYFDQTNFENADLSQVRLSHSWIRQANLRSCILEGVNFGEYPSFIHEEGVCSIDYHQDLNCLVTASGLKVILWNIETGDCIKVLEGHMDRVMSVSISQDGKRVASGGLDKTVRVWDVASGQCTLLQGHKCHVYCVYLSADGQHVISGSGEGFHWDYDYSVRVWEVENGSSKVLIGHGDSVTSVHLSQDGQYVVSGSKDNTVRVWDLSSGQSTVLQGHEKCVYSVHLSANGQWIVSGSLDKTIRVWEITSGKFTVLKGHLAAVRTVHFSENGQHIVSGSDDLTVRRWDVTNRQAIVLHGHEDGICCVRLSTNGKQIISGSVDRTVRIWDVESGEVNIVRKHLKGVNSVHLSANGQWLASGGKDRTVRVWGVESGDSTVLRGHEKSVTSVNLSADGLQLASGSKDLTMQVWDLTHGLSTILRGHQGDVASVQLSADGQRVISVSADRTVQEWEVAKGQSTVLMTGSTCVHLSADNRHVASSNVDDKFVRVLDIGSEETVLLEGHEGTVTSVHLSTNGQRVASGSEDKTVRVWNVVNRESTVLSGHEDIVSSVHLSEDGQCVVSGSHDRTIRVWEVATQSQITNIRFNSKVLSIAVHDLRGLLAVGFDDGTVQLWQRMDDGGRSWQLKWSSTSPNTMLNLGECDISGSKGLSSMNFRLFKQRGGKAESSQEVKVTSKGYN